MGPVRGLCPVQIWQLCASVKALIYHGNPFISKFLTICGSGLRPAVEGPW